MLANAAILFLAAMMLAAAYTDLRGYTIPNWIPGVIVLAWPLAALIFSLSWTEAGLALAAGVAVLAAMMTLWALGGIGGGDAKLIAAGALWFGWPDAFAFLLASAVAGGVLALGLVLMRRFGPVFAPGATGLFAAGPLRAGAPAPYAVAIAAGALWTLPSSGLAAALG